MNHQLQQNVHEFFIATLKKFSQVAYSESIDLHAACRYALTGEGKHIRPLLTLLTADMCGGDQKQALSAAVAIEMVHTYSLIHDDLPCMDDDDVRRGRPTVHKVYGDATALLAGDALLTDAFRVISHPQQWPDVFPSFPQAESRLAQITILAQAAGGRGMVLGQALDMHWTARTGASKQDLDGIHQHKTGCLIAAACSMGAHAASASSKQVEQMGKFGEKLGLAFQICDDLLDEMEGTGKSLGKDTHQGKLTYLRFMSREEAASAAAQLTREAEEILHSFGSRSAPLATLTATLLQRRK